MDERTRLEITWGVSEEEYESDTPTGLSPLDLQDLHSLAPEGTRLGVQPGSVGKGAAGYGTTLLIDLAIGVTGGLIVEAGKVAWKMIKEISSRRGGESPEISDPFSLGVVAAGAVSPAIQETLVGCRYRATVGITGSVGAGTDARDIWAACFDGDGYAVVIFVSPSGLCLGTVKVPAEFALVDDEWKQRTPDDIAEWWREDG